MGIATAELTQGVPEEEQNLHFDTAGVKQGQFSCWRAFCFISSSKMIACVMCGYHVMVLEWSCRIYQELGSPQ